jgi:YcxB-like protein
MRVHFTHSLEEIVDAWLRVHKRSKVVRGMRRNRAVLFALMTALLVLVFFRFSFRGFMVAAVAALIYVIIDPWFYGYEQRKNLRKLLRERYGEQDEFVCQVELLPHTLKTTTSGVEVNFPWEAIEEIVETSDTVDIFARQGFCTVRNRAFSSRDEQQQFIDLAREYMNKKRLGTDK